MKVKLFGAVAFSAAALVASSAAAFAPKPVTQVETLTAATGLYNTGVDAAGGVQANGSPELHYVLVSTPDDVPTALRDATSANGFPIPPWIGDDGLSAWTGPVGFSNLGGASGNYDYQLNFDLTGFNPGTAQIVGRWSTDNAGLDILINGHSTGQTVPYGSSSAGFSFQSFQPFQITGGFRPGPNTLDFIVNNEPGVPGQNPTGLRVELAGTAAAVPEPASWALMIVGFGGIGAALRSRRKPARAAA